jgi:hypothetical protein
MLCGVQSVYTSQTQQYCKENFLQPVPVPPPIMAKLFFGPHGLIVSAKSGMLRRVSGCFADGRAGLRTHDAGAASAADILLAPIEAISAIHFVVGSRMTMVSNPTAIDFSGLSIVRRRCRRVRRNMRTNLDKNTRMCAQLGSIAGIS